MSVRTALGLSLIAVGVWLVLSPLGVADALGRPHDTASKIINLRATFGGTVVGLGAFLAWLPAITPWRRTLLGLLLWSMAGIGVARALGFVLDGHPDALQWAWLSAEALIVAGCVVALRR